METVQPGFEPRRSVDALKVLMIDHSLPLWFERGWDRRAGGFVEIGPADQVLRNPQHQYTQELLASVPELPANPTTP